LPTSERLLLPRTERIGPPELPFTLAERRLIARLRTPAAVQQWLNALPYNQERGGETLRSFRGVVRTGTAHCFEAAMAAAVILEQHRYPGLHGRKPVFATPRALALSYFEGYIDFTGRVKAYAVVDLRVIGTYDWRLAETNIWKAERVLLEWPHRRIASSDARADRLRRRYRAFRKAHGHKPWRYYKGRERWTQLPAEFRDRG
jgi:hypothetical protein